MMKVFAPAGPSIPEDAGQGRRHIDSPGRRARARRRSAASTFRAAEPKRSADRSYDEAAAARLWEVSSGLVGLGALT